MRAAILAGGEASRFGGRPKGLERVGGKRILDRVVEEVTGATGVQPLIVANDPAATSWRPDLPVLPDREPGRGTLGGIFTAVCAGSGPVLVTAWDLPFLDRTLLKALVDRSAGFDAFLPESTGPRKLEPLCAVYWPGCVPAMQAAMRRNDRSAVSFHADVRLGTLPLADVSTHGAPERLFFNLNEPSDLERAERLCQS